MSNFEVLPIALEPYHVARTLVMIDSKRYETVTVDLRLVEDDIDAFQEMIGEYPFETCVYSVIDSSVPYTQFETMMREYVPIDAAHRRDLELGDLYLSRSKDEEAAAMEHDKVVNSFKDGTIVLLTPQERVAIYGPGVMML